MLRSLKIHMLNPLNHWIGLPESFQICVIKIAGAVPNRHIQDVGAFCRQGNKFSHT